MRKSLNFKFEAFRHKYPIFAFGFIGNGNELIISAWIIDFRISWGY